MEQNEVVVPIRCQRLEDFHKAYLYRVLGALVPASGHRRLVDIVNRSTSSWQRRSFSIASLIILELHDEDNADQIHYWVRSKNDDYQSKLVIIERFYNTQGPLPLMEEKEKKVTRIVGRRLKKRKH